MSKNTGVAYEILTQQIFQQLLDQSDVKNVRVERNVFLKGKTTEHQIDVYWQYEIAGIVYSTAVQTKDWSQAVQQGHLLAFKSVLEDLPDQPRGVFVTRTGYQSGAKEYATAHGIKLYELREPTSEETKGRIAIVKFTLNILTPHFSNPQFIIDQPWRITECQKLGIPLTEAQGISVSGLDDEIFFYDEEKQKICNVRTMLQKLLPPHYEQISEVDKQHFFDQPHFLLTGNPRYPRIKAIGIRAKVMVTKEVQTQILKAENMAAFILKDVIAGKSQLIDDQHRSIKRQTFK